MNIYIYYKILYIYIYKVRNYKAFKKTKHAK